VGLSGHPQTKAEVSRELDLTTQSICAQKLLLKLRLHTTPRFSSLTLQAETEKVSFQPPMREWQAWLNNAKKFCSQSNTFSDSRYIFCGASIYVINLWAFTVSSLHYTALHCCSLDFSAKLKCYNVLYPACHHLAMAQQKQGSCIFNQLLSSSTPHPGSLSRQANSKETQCNDSVTEEVLSFGLLFD